MSPSRATSFRTLLASDHERLDAMLASVLKLMHGDVQPKVDDQWAAFEDGLLSHLDAEEMFLLPGLAKHDPTCASRIRDDHARLRETLAEIGVGLDLHVVREGQMQELARFLQQHAKMEELPLYTWADAAIPPSRFALVLRRLRTTWQRTASPAPEATSSNGVQAAGPGFTR